MPCSGASCIVNRQLVSNQLAEKSHPIQSKGQTKIGSELFDVHPGSSKLVSCEFHTPSTSYAHDYGYVRGDKRSGSGSGIWESSARHNDPVRLQCSQIIVPCAVPSKNVLILLFWCQSSLKFQRVITTIPFVH